MADGDNHGADGHLPGGSMGSDGHMNPFTRNQNVMDANRDFLFKISNIEQGMGKAAVDFSTKAAAGDKEFQKGMALARDMADVTAWQGADFLRDGMARSIMGGSLSPEAELRDVRLVLEKYNIHAVGGSPAQIQAELYHIMRRSQCPEEVKEACQRGINAAKAGIVKSRNRGFRRSRHILARNARQKLNRSEYGRGQAFTLNVIRRGREMLKTGLRAMMLAKRAATFAHLKAETAKAHLAAETLRRNPGQAWAKGVQKRTAKKRDARFRRKEKKLVRRRKFRKWLEDPIGIKRLGRRAADRLLKTRAGRAVSFPVRMLNAVKGAVAKAVATCATVVSMLVTILLLLGLFLVAVVMIMGAVVSMVGSMMAAFDFTATDEDVQQKMLAAIQQCYTEQVESINACYGNYENVMVNYVDRRTDSVYEEAELELEETTNVAEILCMANIYFDFELDENAEDAVEYVKALYAASNQVDFDISVDRTEHTGEVDADGDPVAVTYYNADITVTRYYFNDIFEVDIGSESGGAWTGDMSGLPAWITPEAMQAVLEVQRDKDIPAAAILGQMILESTGTYPGGCSGLCYKNNNCLGITKHDCQIKGTSSSSWGTKEYYGKYVSVNRSFQAYKSLGDCIRCYGSTDIVSGKPSTLRKCTTDPKTRHYSTASYVTAVWKAGYATSPTYVQNVMKIVRAYNLERFNSMSPTSVGSGMVTGAQAVIACGDYYNSVLENAVRRGEKWVYSNSSKYVAQTGSFEKMLAGKVRGGNCATIANWAFRDMGIIKKNEKFYGDRSGKIRNYNSGSTKLKLALDRNCTVINGGGRKFSALVKEGQVLPGDVLIGKGHTFVYRGGGTVFASGHDGKWHSDKSAKTEDSRKAVFESWVRPYKGSSDENFKVQYIIRVKDTFVPAAYRDANGRLVKNR